MHFMTSTTHIGRLLVAMTFAMLGSACIGGGDGGGGGNSTAGVSNSTLVGELTQEEANGLCMHYDSMLNFDSSRGCCVGNAIYGSMDGTDSCESILADCEADPASFECDEDESGSDSDDCNDPPPTCEGDVTVGVLSTCLDDMAAQQQMQLDSLGCDTPAEELDNFGDADPPASCDAVLSACPGLFSGDDDGEGSGSEGGSSAGSSGAAG